MITVWVAEVRLSERQLAFLRALAGQERPVGAARVFILAFPDEPYRGRRDAGATRTLDGLARLGLVTFSYTTGGQQPSRDWWITALGKEALSEHAG